jgi:hypothetical protein
MPSWTQQRSRIAVLSREIKRGERQPNDRELVDAKRAFAAARIEESIRKILADAPTLTDEQCASITALLTRTRRARGGVNASS